MKKNKDNNSFRDMSVFEKMFVIIAFALLIVLSISFVIGIFSFGFVGIFSLFGVQYTSSYSLIGFILFFFLFGAAFDVFSMALIKISSQYISGKYKLLTIRMVIDCTFTWLALHVVDEFMNSVTLPLDTEIVAVILFFFIEIAFDAKEKNKK